MQSESVQKLAEALAKAQAEMPIVPMNSINPFLKNRFADLGAVIQSSRPVLAKHGLSITQFPISDGANVGVTSTLMHSSGEWMSQTVSLPLAEEKGKSAAQVAGSIVTYLRRYSWSSILGLYADEDTDGHQPEKKSEPKRSPEQNMKELGYPEDQKLRTDNPAWTAEQKNALIEAKLAKDDFSAAGMLGLSNLPHNAPIERVLEWGRVYRTRRDATNPATEKPFTAKEAAAFANNGGK